MEIIKNMNNISFTNQFITDKESFYRLLHNDVKNIIKIQLELIYMDDSKIDNSEALHKVDLQEDPLLVAVQQCFKGPFAAFSVGAYELAVGVICMHDTTL